ncbi:MAG: 3-phosphoshikimate 1-carboxyvinyltransferase [Bacteroidota bacterium]
MKYITSPALFIGKVTAPPSKSYLQRAIAIAGLSKTECSITGYNQSDDTDAAIDVARTLGVKIDINNNVLYINGINDFNLSAKINCRESGLAARMFSMIASLFNGEIEVSGTGTLLNRPVNIIEDALKQLGKTIFIQNNSFPVTISGNIQHSEIYIDGSVSSQVLTGLLIALPLANQNSIIHVADLKSVSYIEMTLEILNDFGIVIRNSDFKRFEIQGGQIPYKKDYSIEGDWSGAAFHLVGGAIAGEVTVSGLRIDSVQADKAILDVLSNCGAYVKTDNKSVTVKKDLLKPFCFDATDCPDLFPPLAVLAACCMGISTIKGISRLKYKESNRAIIIKQEFEKLGVVIEFEEDNMIILGNNIQGGKVSAHNDHRIAMACAILGLVAENAVEIEGVECVRKSYPAFFKDYESIIIKTAI